MRGGVGAVVVLLLTGTLTGYAAEQHAVNWTEDGVEQYQTDPLEVAFGDTITFKCDPNIISNFVYVEMQEQYDRCNSSVSSGQALQIADCLVRLSGPISFDLKIQQLSGGDREAVVDYQAGKSHYFYSSFNDALASSDPPYIGGQCLTGLKMVISVVTTTTTVVSTTPGLTTSPPLEMTSGSGSGSGSSPSLPSATIKPSSLPSMSPSPTLPTSSASTVHSLLAAVSLCSLLFSLWSCVF